MFVNGEAITTALVKFKEDFTRQYRGSLALYVKQGMHYKIKFTFL